MEFSPAIRIRVKRGFALALAGVCLLSLCACAENEPIESVAEERIGEADVDVTEEQLSALLGDETGRIYIVEK